MQCVGACPPNPFQAADAPDLASAANRVLLGTGLAIAAAIFVVYLARLRTASRPRRRALIAVAASSAFPFLLTPITFTNHGEPSWYKPPAGLKHATGDYYIDRRRYTWAEHQSTYLDKGATPYVHVMDGGLADNIGWRALT